MGKDQFLKIFAVIMFMALILTPACKKDESCSIHPEAFRFSIIDTETDADLLETGVYSAEDIGIHYFYNDTKQDLIINQEANSGEGYTELFSAQLPMISLTRSEIFYLVLNPQETDTLVVLMGREKRDGCDFHPYAEVRHNGKNLAISEGEAFIIEK